MWPSGEATTHSSGSMPLFHSEFCTEIYLKILFFFHLPFPSLPLSFLTDESAEEGAPRLLTKEEKDIDTLQHWVQVGGFPAQLEEEAWELLVEVCLLYPLFLLFK